MLVIDQTQIGWRQELLGADVGGWMYCNTE
jgi:hypothetical protein